MTQTLILIGIGLVVSALAELYVARNRHGSKRVPEDIQ